MQLKRIALTLAVALAALAAVAQLAPAGPWHGKLSMGLKKLNIVFNFNADGSCTLDSPDQGASGIAAEAEVLRTDSVVVTVPSLGVRFAGRVEASTIIGKFKQGSYTFPLTLRPGRVDAKRPQTPRPPFPYATENVRVPAGDAVLSATISYPESYDSLRAAEVPLVVLVSGSGLQNRDEEILQHKPFAVIADYVARHGIATLRYDDRGFGMSTGSNDTATTLTYADDAAAAVAFARSLGRFGRVGVLGHSEGGTIAFMLGARGDVDFAISMAGAAERGLDILLRQNRRALAQAGMGAEVIDAYCLALAAVLESNELTEAMLAPLPAGLADNLRRMASEPAVWLRYFAVYDPAPSIAAVRCPVFAFNGNLDTQVDAEANLGLIGRLLPRNGNNLVRQYDGLNHLMQHCATGNFDEYGAIEETIAPEVLSDIVWWIDALQGE